MVRTTRIVIPGTRAFRDYALMERVLDRLLAPLLLGGTPLEIVSGHAEGADLLGERYAREHEIPCKVFPAQWDKFGPSAGPRRNAQMLHYAQGGDPLVIAFWDGSSRGTLDTLMRAMRESIPATVVLYDERGGYKLVRFVYERGE